jgi:uncharacterized protein YciI
MTTGGPDAPRTAEPPDEFDSYQLILLRRPDVVPTFDEAKSDLLQGQHLGHFANMKEQGHLKVAGPLRDQADESMRGICLYQVASLEEARRLAELDPAVQAGLYVVDTMAWFTAKGALAFGP